jgi:hypothetical protein
MEKKKNSMETNQVSTNSSENIYGLKSYTDGREMWKVMTSKWSDEEVNQAQILNDSRFEKTLAIRILEKMLEYENGEISEEFLNKCLNIGSSSDYLVGFNFFLYSEKAKKWYSSIVFYNNHALEAHECTEEHFKICEELFKLYNIGAITLKATIFFKKNRDIVEEGGEKFRKAFLEFWDNDDKYTQLLKDTLSPFLSI